MKKKKADDQRSAASHNTHSTSNTPIIPQEQNAQHKQAKATNEGNDASRLFRNLKRINSNHVMVLFTAGLFAASALQWWLTRDTFRIGNRAYLGVKDAKIFQTGPLDSSGRTQITDDTSRPKLGLSPVLEVKLSNSGATPAFNANGWAILALGERPLVSDPPYPLHEISNSRFISRQAVPKDSEMDFHGGRMITEQDRQDIMNGTKFLMIYGAVNYTDAFGSKHTTKFCYFYQSSDDDMAACPAARVKHFETPGMDIY